MVVGLIMIVASLLLIRMTHDWYLPRADHYERHGWPEHEWEVNDQEISDMVGMIVLAIVGLAGIAGGVFIMVIS